jgi:hypothetical protein
MALVLVSTAAAVGCPPTGMVAVTVLVRPSTTDTVLVARSTT